MCTILSEIVASKQKKTKKLECGLLFHGLSKTTLAGIERGAGGIEKGKDFGCGGWGETRGTPALRHFAQLVAANFCLTQ